MWSSGSEKYSAGRWGTRLWVCDLPIIFVAHTIELMSLDHKPFLSERFDVHAYANAVLSGKSYRPDEDDEAGTSERGRRIAEDKERVDVGSELAKLNHGIVSSRSQSWLGS